MLTKSLVAIVSFAALALLGAAPRVLAQEPLRAQLAQYAPLPPPPLMQRPRTRIEVGPPPLLYRRCAVRYVLQPRPSGTVLFPEQHCWWVRGY